MLRFFHQERGKGCPEPVYRQEQCIVENDLVEVCGRMSIFLLMLERCEERGDDRPYEHKVHDRRDQRKKDLKDPDVRHRNKAEKAIPPVKEGVLVLPHALQSSERPTEPLLCKVAKTVGLRSARSHLLHNRSCSQVCGPGSSGPDPRRWLRTRTAHVFEHRTPPRATEPGTTVMQFNEENAAGQSFATSRTRAPAIL